MQQIRPDDDRPNIVFIITDQQRFDTIAELGASYAHTPHLDRLVREGVAFNQCHVTAASCAAARASLFKGYYPHTTGILKNADNWQRSWIELLNDSGYYCVNVGKMHTWPFDTPLGFHERYVVENKDRYLEGRYYFDEWDRGLRYRGMVKQQRESYRKRADYRERLGAFDWELPEDTHPDVFVGEMARWWIASKPPTSPLFLQIGFPGPHPPYDPVPRYTERYLPQADLGVLPVSAAELAGQPLALEILRQHNADVDHDSVVALLEPSKFQRHRQRAYYLANVTMIDQQVGQIMEALENNKYLDNTIVIFTSDHGDCLTDHGQSQKWTMYDAITRVPMIVWSPERFAPARIESLVQQMDLGATIMEWADLEIPESWAARSLAVALESPERFAGRERVFCEQAGDGVLTGCDYMTMVRDAEFKLIHFHGGDIDPLRPQSQLFDLSRDPHEMNNLWDDPASLPRREAMLAELLAWRIQSGLDAKDWCAQWR
ncbi:MAG: sulfatase-like hydrolase/transferase [Planctomycetota bacterium]